MSAPVDRIGARNENVAMCQSRPNAPQQAAALLLVGEPDQWQWHTNAPHRAGLRPRRERPRRRAAEKRYELPPASCPT